MQKNKNKQRNRSFVCLQILLELTLEVLTMFSCNIFMKIYIEVYVEILLSKNALMYIHSTFSRRKVTRQQLQ